MTGVQTCALPIFKNNFEIFNQAYTNYAIATAVANERDALVRKTLSSEESQLSLLSKFKPIRGKDPEGNPIIITPQDQFDLAMYLNENYSVLPFSSRGDESRSRSKAAESRLKAAGKEWLLDEAIRQNYPATATEGITSLVRVEQDLVAGITKGVNKL